MNKTEILKELRREVRLYQESYAEGEGKQRVRDKGALRTITALKAAIEIVRKSR